MGFVLSFHLYVLPGCQGWLAPFELPLLAAFAPSGCVLPVCQNWLLSSSVLAGLVATLVSWAMVLFTFSLLASRMWWSGAGGSEVQGHLGSIAQP